MKKIILIGAMGMLSSCSFSYQNIDIQRSRRGLAERNETTTNSAAAPGNSMFVNDTPDVLEMPCK